MRTSRFALLVSAILISILFTALVVVNREAVAQPWPNIDITDIEPAPEYCMPVSNTLVLMGTGLTIPGIQIQVRLPDSTSDVRATIMNDDSGRTDRLNIQIPQSRWAIGIYRLTATHPTGATDLFYFRVDPGGSNCPPRPGLARGDG